MDHVPQELLEFKATFESGAYVKLLRFDLETYQRVVDCVIGAGPSLESDIGFMISHPNWRVQIVGLAAALKIGITTGMLAVLWQRLDQGSWVAPQLVAALRQLDPDFSGAALARLKDFAVGDYSETLPAFRAKTASALVALTKGSEFGAEVETLIEHSPLRRLLDADQDRSAEIALAWLAASQHAMKAL